MSDQTAIYVLGTLPIYFFVLYFVVVPLLKIVSIRIQGAAFTYRLRSFESTRTPEEYAKYDYYWSLLATAIAFVLAVLPFVFIHETGLGDRWFGS